VVELVDDLVAALRGIQIEGLQRGTVELLEPVPPCHPAPGIQDVRPQGELSGIKVPKSRQGLGLHGRKVGGMRGGR